MRWLNALASKASKHHSHLGYEGRNLKKPTRSSRKRKPSSKELDLAARTRDLEEATVQGTPRVAETILLVEDEAAVRTLAKRVLFQKGYRVLEASDGAIALRLAAGHVGEIDLVLTDVAMPNLGGRGLVEELKELSPGMRVLFMSGYPKEEVFPDKGANRVPYLQKPFTSEALLAEVRTAFGYAP